MLRTLFVLAILVPGFVAALRDRFKALLLYQWFAFFRPQDWVWIDISSLRLSLVLGLVLLIPSLSSGIMPNLSHPLSIGSVLFVAATLVAQANAVNAAVGWLWIDFLVRLVIVCLLMVTLANTPRRLLAVIAVVAGSLGFHAAKAGLLSVISGGLRFSDGLAGAFVDNNGYALATVMIMPLLLVVSDNLGLLVPDEYPLILKWVRRGLRIAVLLCMFTVISTFSRAGFLAMIGATLVYVALHRRRVRLALVLSALVVAGLTLAPLPEGYGDRIETIQTYEEVGDQSALSRPHFWRVAMAMAEAEPLGIGLRNYEYAYDQYDFSHGQFGRGRSVHSSHFQVLAELGYFGAMLWVGQFLVALAISFRIRRQSRTPGLSESSARFLLTLSNGLIASMAGFLVGGSFIALALNDLTWLTFGLVAAADRIASTICAEVAKPIPMSVAAVRPDRTWRPAARTAAYSGVRKL
jgi:probable O-glycosylation ligase (exosortase A-associated)